MVVHIVRPLAGGSVLTLAPMAVWSCKKSTRTHGQSGDVATPLLNLLLLLLLLVPASGRTLGKAQRHEVGSCVSEERTKPE